MIGTEEPLRVISSCENRHPIKDKDAIVARTDKNWEEFIIESDCHEETDQLGRSCCGATYEEPTDLAQQTRFSNIGSLDAWLPPLHACRHISCEWYSLLHDYMIYALWQVIIWNDIRHSLRNFPRRRLGEVCAVRVRAGLIGETSHDGAEHVTDEVFNAASHLFGGLLSVLGGLDQSGLPSCQRLVFTWKNLDGFWKS